MSYDFVFWSLINKGVSKGEPQIEELVLPSENARLSDSNLKGLI